MTHGYETGHIWKRWRLFRINDLALFAVLNTLFYFISMHVFLYRFHDALNYCGLVPPHGVTALVIIGSGNGLSPAPHQTMPKPVDRTLENNLYQTWINIQKPAIQMHMKMSCTKRRSFFLHQQFKCIKFECDCIKSFNDGLSLVASKRVWSH